jgi:hypothetical protein
MSYNELIQGQLLWEQEGWCIACGVDFEPVKEQIKELNNLLVALGKHSFGENYESIDYEHIDSSLWVNLNSARTKCEKDFVYWSTISKLSTGTQQNTREKSLMDLFAYLLLVEGSYSEIVQLISVFLVDSGHDIFDPIRNDFALTYEDIEKIDLSIKLKFLEKHGFGLIVNGVDRKLRNDIAHLNLQVLANGRVVDTKRGQEIKDITDKTKYLRWLCWLVLITLEWLFQIV